MKTKSSRSLWGFAGLALLVAGCSASPPPSPPPPPSPLVAACAETATIALWVENGQHKARVYGNGSGPTESKHLYVDGQSLSVGSSEICWELVAIPPLQTSDVLWVHVKDFGRPIFPGNGQFDPNLNRRHRLVYGQHPSSWPDTAQFPPGSGQTFAAARVAYKVWIKLQGGSPPFEADPDLVIIKPRG